MRRRWFALWFALLIVTGCAPGVEVLQAVGYAPSPDSQATIRYVGRSQSDVVFSYGLPPPPPGHVYVLWATDAEGQRVERLGEIQPGRRRVRATVNFRVERLIVSEERDANASGPGRWVVAEPPRDIPEEYKPVPGRTQEGEPNVR